jgi:hypothetical protein
MIEYVLVTVYLSNVSAIQSYSKGLQTVCEYRMDKNINYYKSWYPTYINIPYGNICPPYIKEKLDKRYYGAKPTPYEQWFHYNKRSK